MEANHVIVTVPLGVLKAGCIDFIPKLPQDKQDAIDKLGMGLLNKCTMLWNEDDVLPWPSDKEWIERIIVDPQEGRQGRWTEFYSPPIHNCIDRPAPILYAYSSGQAAQCAEEEYSNEETKQEVLSNLKSIFGSSYVPEPEEVLLSRWGEDEFSMGAYSYQRVGSTLDHRRDLGRPLNHRLYFAGEATHPRQFATTQGALLSGIHVAKTIISGLSGTLPGRPRQKRRRKDP